MQVVLKSHTFDFYRNSCPPMNGCYKMQTFEQLQRVRLVPRTAQAGKGVLFQPGYIAAADAELCGNLLLRLRDGAIQPYRRVKICCSRSGRAVTSWRS